MPPKRKGASKAAASKKAKTEKEETTTNAEEKGEEKKATKGGKKGKEVEEKEEKKLIKNGVPDINTLDFSSDAKTKDGRKWNLKLSAWNVNGLRAWIEKDSQHFIELENPDIICLQETKCSEGKIPPKATIEGYNAHWLSGDQEGYSGVGLYTKVKPINITYGIGIQKHDQEGRVITAEFDDYYFVGVYVPNAGKKLVRLDYRMDWDNDFRSYLKSLDEKKSVIVCGDLNVAHEVIDIANPKGNTKNAGFTKEERESFTKLLQENKFIDTFRHLYPDRSSAYTFWTYMMNARAKNVGWRLDYFLISERLLPNLCDSIIRSNVYGSDHCPVSLLLAM